MFLLWHPSLTAINLSYTFPILETSATALSGTTGNLYYVLKSYLYVVPIDVELMDDFFLSVLVYQRWCIFCKDLPRNKPEEVMVLAVYRLPIPSPAQAWTWKQRWQKTKRTVGPVGPVGPRLGWTWTDPVLSLLFTVPLTVGNEYNMYKHKYIILHKYICSYMLYLNTSSFRSCIGFQGCRWCRSCAWFSQMLWIKSSRSCAQMCGSSRLRDFWILDVIRTGIELDC